MTEHICPLCKKPMLKRSGSRGMFYGCSSYPLCKHTYDVPPDEIKDTDPPRTSTPSPAKAKNDPVLVEIRTCLNMIQRKLTVIEAKLGITKEKETRVHEDVLY